MIRLFRFFIFFILSPFQGQSQTLFEHTFNFNSFAWPSNIVKIYEHYYLSCNERNEINGFSRIFKINENGQFIDSIDIMPIIGNRALNYQVLNQDSLFIFIGFYYNNHDVWLYYRNYSMDFEFVSENKYLIDTAASIDYINLFGKIVNNDKILCGITTIDYPSYRPRQIFVKSNVFGETLITKQFFYPGGNCNWDFISLYDRFYCPVFSTNFSDSLNCWGQIFILNDSLELKKVLPIPDNLWWDQNISLYKEKILISGRKPNEKEFEIRLTDTSFQPIYNRYIIGRPEPHNYPATRNFSISPDSTIFFGGTLNVDFVPEDDYIVNSQLVLARLDSNLNPIWQKTYGGETSYYMSNILATDDGGCIMTAGRYRLHNDSIRRDVYILKVDKWGNTVSEITRPVPGNAINAYPNPAKDMVRFELPPLHGKVSIEISNLSGQIIQNIVVPNQNLNLNIADWEPGLYMYRVLVNGKLVFTGKLVKE